MINIQRFVCNMLQENCYVVSDDSKECVIIDCGAWYEQERKAVKDYVVSNGLTPTHLLCTHGHVDHNFGIDTISEAFGLLPEIHEEDAGFMEHLSDQAVEFIGIRPSNNYPAVGHYLKDGDEIGFGTHQLHVIHTPGHSRGSVCFHIPEEHVLFTGDTLFRQSIGRTDFEGGSMMQIIQSLRLLAQLPDETVVLTGHGPQTTMGDELRSNPFLDR
ncbi:MAG: MBL fold metallo-hydrolase [Prevotella sp.]|nr:MBL fold metallo-hydrolase [Prevotella sp.]